MLAFGLGFTYLPPANEVWGKVICLQVCVCPQGGCCPSMHSKWYPSMPCSRSGGGGYPSMHCRWYTSMPCSRSWGGGGSGPGPGPQPRGKLRGVWSGGVPGRGVCLFQGGACSRGCLVETATLRLLLRAVRILLECILVYGTR